MIMSISPVDIQLSTLDIVALTIFGEARGLDLSGRVAVGLVIAHRVAHPKVKYGEGWAAVCRRPWQFSCWVEAGGKENYEYVQRLAGQVAAGQEPAGPNAWTECLWIAEGVMEGVFVDIAHGATHYLTRALYESNPPAWARGVQPVAEISGHVFFRL